MEQRATNQTKKKRMTARDWAILAGIAAGQGGPPPARAFHGLPERLEPPGLNALTDELKRLINTRTGASGAFAGTGDSKHAPQSPESYRRPAGSHLSSDSEGERLPYGGGNGGRIVDLRSLSALLSQRGGRKPYSPPAAWLTQPIPAPFSDHGYGRGTAGGVNPLGSSPHPPMDPGGRTGGQYHVGGGRGNRSRVLLRHGAPADPGYVRPGEPASQGPTGPSPDPKDPEGQKERDLAGLKKKIAEEIEFLIRNPSPFRSKPWSKPRRSSDMFPWPWRPQPFLPIGPRPLPVFPPGPWPGRDDYRHPGFRPYSVDPRLWDPRLMPELDDFYQNRGAGRSGGISSYNPLLL